MDRRDQRPPRSAPPRGNTANPTSNPPAYHDDPHNRPPLNPTPAGRGNVSFQNTELGDRHGQVDDSRQRYFSAYRDSALPPTPDDLALESGAGSGFDPSRVARKKSLVRPDREKIEPGHRLWHYRTHAAQLEDEGAGRLGLLPSSTGNYPQRAPLRRGKSLLAREQDVPESGLALFKRGATLRRNRSRQTINSEPDAPQKKRRCCSDVPGPLDAWMMYCVVITICIPGFMLSVFGIRTPEQQRAWREKMGLLSIIMCLMAGVGFITFGFTQAVCGTPADRFRSGSVGNSSVIIHGYDYDFSKFDHPATGSFDGHSNPLFEGNWGVAGADISFMFQNVGGSCRNIITRASNSTIPVANDDLEWYFPCNVFNQFGTSGVNLTNYDTNTTCHVSSTARGDLAKMSPQGQVYYTWDDVKNPSRNLAVYQSNVLDFSLLNWLNKAQVSFPDIFEDFKTANGTYNARDITMMFLRTNQKPLGKCLQDIITVGFIDTITIGCVASDIVLYVSLIFIIGVVAIKFGMAVIFGWFLSWRLGAFGNETYEQRMRRAAEIENWTDDIYRPAPSSYRPNVQKNGMTDKYSKRKTALFPSTSRFTPSETVPKLVGSRGADAVQYKRSTTYGGGGAKKLSPPDTPAFRSSRSSTSLVDSASQKGSFNEAPCPFPLNNVVPQPSADYMPFNFPLAHTICLVTAYSESVAGLRTTLDSLATTDYPNSHKLLMVIADGMVKGAGNDLATPDIVLSMMTELVVPADEVEAHSYVAIADGHKKHNMAKVYAGFYSYDDNTVERSKQQRVPIVLVAKCGNPLEANDPKPGNRGKRDSQIVLMAFMQKVMFDERMTTLEYEFFNSIWRVTGVSPDRYELVLCVDADTKVFPDSLTRMVSCMVHDEEIMGLCGETKIANKAETWVTMIQVFEYYISHHMTKAFESMFGGVTCLPGCFSMYRLKAPKGAGGYWVPILANPDIVEHYSENVVDTLHKKNLLLLGEDRFLTTLMLKTFPKRKMIFCPQAVCKTIVPDTFSILLSQRRRWINSTVHNLFELLLVRDLCGTFCFSMQFVVFMELAGTLVLPAAISFTLFLIIESIIPGGSSTTIPLILLAIILGLPGLLIVVTSRKVAYVGWMLIYLLSLPIWNFVLPAYAYWHFDDFSWGQTRQISGDKGGSHGDKEGEFDSSHIVMKRWAEFERERRWRGGTQSRDSTFFDMRSNSPKRTSMISTSETFQHQSSDMGDSFSYGGQPRPRFDSSPLVMLPAPLAVNNSRPTGLSTTPGSRNSEEVPMLGDTGSRARLIPSPPGDYSAYSSPEPFLPPPSNPIENFVNRAGQGAGGSMGGVVLRQGTVSSAYPGETQNPYRTTPQQAAGYDEDYSVGTTTTSESDDTQASAARQQSSPQQYQAQQRARGISLEDRGPVPGPEGVRRVARPQSRRPSSQQPQTNRYSRSSLYNLPPGAAPPRPQGDYQ
ncbi:glycosyltransferase family 2 protein [Fomitiporia mediterranea MF3/22]|uniref:glycosyltransferase family 2 protein n=1 Tax=Fomitiporia mediterranea (strain MF3/22) TaxID=694068 RepID=UPI00044089F4|nr:glycosyltransferase family 2 protein [Fomitiporia mediterranea MF3/22]EJC98606.1 glycosyltransferase family 2 protein [Fomitiporia mediterranea MF3/22]